MRRRSRQQPGSALWTGRWNRDGTALRIELVDWIQEARGKIDALIINAAAYTHTSVAIHDALKLLDIPIIEVHISNPKEREEFRHFSYVESVAKAVIAGQGTEGYIMALDECVKTLKS